MTAIGPQHPAAVRTESAMGSQAGAVVQPEPGVGELFSKLGSEIATLVRQEMLLAKTEMVQKFRTLVRNVVIISVGAGVGLLGLMALTAALILGLSNVMDPWLAALCVGGLYALIAVLAISKGVAALRRLDVKPEQTVETLKENKQWAQELVR